jgi:hypothetical protein
MPKQVRHDKSVILNLALKQVQGLRFQNLVLEFDIPLRLAYLLVGRRFSAYSEYDDKISIVISFPKPSKT